MTRALDRFSPAVIARGLLVAGAVTVGAMAILSTRLAPGHARGRLGPWVLHRASRLLLCSLGVHLAQRTRPRPGAALVVATDLSWLDVLVLCAAGPVLPVADAKVARWPLIGSLARHSGAIFVDRSRLSGLPGEVGQIAAALRRGHRVLVFPSVGQHGAVDAQPFRRAAFQAAVDAAVVVAPVAVTYRGSADRPRMMTHRRTAEVSWLTPIPAIVAGGHRAGDRARAAAAAQRAITRALHQPVAGPTPAPSSTGRTCPTEPVRVATETTGLSPVPRAA